MAKRSKDTRNFTMSDFYCTKCGLKNFPIIRAVGKERESGHLKKLFCLYCQEDVNMVEIKQRGKYTLNDFWIEYNYGNFNLDGTRKMPWKQFVIQTREKGVDIK